jgi:hypothetical protein
MEAVELPDLPHFREWKGNCTLGRHQQECAMSSAVRIFVPPDLIPLQQAVLCANCEVISDSRNGHCIVCGSPSLLNLARVLNGQSCSTEKRARALKTRARACRSVCECR